MGVASHGLLEGGLVLHANDDQRVRFCGGVGVLQGAFVRGVIALDENLLEWQIVANECVNPVFVLQHDFLRNIFTKVLHLPDRTAYIAVSGA